MVVVFSTTGRAISKTKAFSEDWPQPYNIAIGHFAFNSPLYKETGMLGYFPPREPGTAQVVVCAWPAPLVRWRSSQPDWNSPRLARCRCLLVQDPPTVHDRQKFPVDSQALEVDSQFIGTKFDRRC